MARKLNAREITLLGALIVAAATVLYFRDDSGLFGGGADQEREAAPLGDAPLVRVDRLMAQGDGFDPTGRNLFEYYTPPPPKRPPPPPRPPVKPQTQTQQQRPVTPRGTQRTEAQAARPPKITFRYLGFLGPKEEKIGVFENGQELELAAIGEVIERDFRLVEFKYESVVLGYVDERFSGQTAELKMSR